MSQTIFITGASSGIGKATAKLFQARGWNVVATMRTPAKEEELTKLDRVLVTRLDVTERDSIETAVAAAHDEFGSIDVLVNNAGYGTLGPLESFSVERIRRQFDTNVIGLIATTQALIPHFRARQSGTIINISSIGGRMAFPLMSLYHGTKWAVEGLSEALYFEMGAIGVKVKIVEPGGVRTDFGGRSLDLANDESLAEYQAMVGKFLGVLGAMSEGLAEPTVSAEVIHRAATDGTNQLRYPAGADAEQLLSQRATVDDMTFIAGIETQFGL